MIRKILDILYERLPKNVVRYLMNHNGIEERDVTKWLHFQLIAHNDLLHETLIDNNLIGTTDDVTIWKILRWVHARLTYTSDRLQYKTSEYWATVDETLKSMKGDCEDGAALIFCLARAAGIDHRKIFLCAGSVKSGGHAWVRYISDKYIWTTFFIDWCYWYESDIIRKRTAYINDKQHIKPNDKYKKFWFMTNDMEGFSW